MFKRIRFIPVLIALLVFSTVALAEIQLRTMVLPEGRSVDVRFVRMDRAPARATMQASLKYERGQATINLSIRRMEPAVLFAGDISAYVLWAVTSDGIVENLGEVLVDRKGFSGSQQFSTGKKIFALLVTAEPLAVAERPTELPIFISDTVKPRQAIGDPFVFDNFQVGAKPALESISGFQYDDTTPVAIKQAQNALKIAEKMNADAVNPEAMKDARTAFAQAENTAQAKGSRAVVIDYARRAIELSSQAIRDTNRALQAKAAAEAEAKRQAQKAALEQRASDAESESQRIARQLREVEAQRAALARESQELTAQSEKLADERDQTAEALKQLGVERDEIAAERDEIAAERDELANMLKNALSSVAETNETARGVIVSLPGILFDVNKATLKTPAQLTVAKLAGILMVFQKMNLSIEGYTDSTGTDEINMKLSTERARAVYDFLWSQGIDQNRMTYKGFGPANPVAPNDTLENRAKNRRVEVVLIQPPKDK